LSVLVAIIGGWASGNWMHWLYQACVLLVVACPCAIVISVPMAYVLSIARASKKGILVKGGNYLDIINKSKVICFDKTGTLTKGELKISAVVPLNGKTEDEILSIAASLELNSTHPIADAINALADSKKVKILDLDITENAGMEIYALDGKGNKYEIGNKKILKDHSLDDKLTSTNVVILLNGICIGYILLEDTLKNDIKEKIAQIYASGINEEIILSGDNKFAVANCAKDLGINEYYPELLPEEKVEKLKSLLNEKKNVMFVGDGINDAPSIALSSCGISMGNIGSDVAIQTSDIVILDDDISKIAFLKKLSRINNLIVYSNIIAAILVKVIVMILAIVLPNGIPLWLAIFADVGMLILCILHSLTLIKRRIKY
jgi:Cd2+/Zn2+-exporting ATPase